MITHLTVKNFKCLKDVSLRLSPFTVVIGKNDTGKSSVFEALQLLASVTAAEYAVRAFAGGDMRPLIWNHDITQPLEWELQIEPDARNGLPGRCTYHLSLEAAGSDITIANESFVASADHGEAVLQRRKQPNFDKFWLADSLGPVPGNVRDQVIPKNRTVLYEGKNLSAREFLTFSRFRSVLQGILRYRLNATATAIPAPLPHDHAPVLREDGYGLAMVLSELAGTNRTAIAALEADLQRLAPAVASVQTPTTPIQTRDGLIGGKALAYKLVSGAVVSGALASEGVRLLTALLAIVHSSPSPNLLLIEEPETAIHPRQLEKIVALLRCLADPKREGGPVQVVCTTHSPYFLDFVKPDEVIAMGRRSSGETVASRLSDLQGVNDRVQSGYTLGEVWYTVGEDDLLKDLLK